MAQHLCVLAAYKTCVAALLLSSGTQRRRDDVHKMLMPLSARQQN